ncbi:MAG: aminopeptidase P family protein [Oscillospiraceae bacterium]|nr:aminopeptidase P family protein [Oscillospiraceae bacterium]
MNHILQIQKKLIEHDLDAILLSDEKNQRYAAGFPFTDGYVLVSREKAWLITDSRYIEAAEKAAGGVAQILMYDNRKPKIRLLKTVLAEAGITALAAEDKKLCHADYMALEKLLGFTLQPAGDLMAELRASKDEEELRSMITAQRISEKALEETLQIIRPGMTEKEVAAELVYRMLKHGSEGNSFDPIVVTGKNTSLPHGVPGDTVLQPGDFLTMDFGSLKDGYCSDMTRTVAVCSATDEMKQVYATVLEAQLAGIAAGRSGIPGKEIDAAARKVITEAGFGEYFGHGFGHSLGLDIHEAPFANPRGEAIMPENCVCSAEPGIYLPGKFGVRIEDVMVLRPEGSEVITLAPKQELLIVGN